ncbi:hypothetical protein DW194_07995, partial [Subdoligranulum sp. AM16-9]
DCFSVRQIGYGGSGVAVAIETEAPEEALESAVEAKDGCPVAAIEEIDRGEMSCYTTLKSALV